MLKKICGLFLGLVVLAGSACVTPTRASSAHSVVLTYIQAAGVAGAKEELVVIHNNTAVEVDITDWCLTNKLNVAFACFTAQVSPEGTSRFILLPYQSATIASQDYVITHGGRPDAFSLTYSITNQSSGSIVSSADTVSLADEDGSLVDIRTWTSSLQPGKGWARVKLLSAPNIYATGNDSADWNSVAVQAFPASGLEIRLAPPEIPDEHDDEEGSIDIPPPEIAIPPIEITELLPNAEGSDTGKEFIELHNKDELTPHTLDRLKIRVGGTSPKWYSLPSVLVIPAAGYLVFTDIELGFTLVNTQGEVQLYYDDIPFGESITYTGPKDDEAWALIDDVWQYTKVPTPGFENVASPAETDEVAEADEAVIQKPCASNQFRNPETGRCKLIAAATSSPAPCKVGQERNPETNRCRTIAVKEVPAPCKEGQERNPETNRCRNIVKMSTVGFGVKGVQTKAGAQLSWYYWAAIIGIIVLIAGYAFWEWRGELGALWRKLRGMFAKH